MKKYLDAENNQLVFSGTDYFKILEQVISESKRVLHLQTYIFDNDTTGLKVVESLKKASARGVKVFVLVDAYGSFPFSSQVKQDFQRSGIHFRLFSPLFSSESGFFGRRLHHKIVVADGQVALIGGINIADKYGNSQPNEEPWLDYALLTRGKVCEYLSLLCEQIYHKKRSKLNGWEKTAANLVGNEHTRLVRFRRNDWIKRKNEIHQSYVQSIVKAESSITLVASYFLPGTQFRRILRNAAKRGVSIKIILAGKSDVTTVRLAQQYLYEFYLSNNIQLFEWQNSVLHGKAMLVDTTWATIGSYNLNFLSHYISIELNADVIDPQFAMQFSNHLNSVMENSCKVVDLEKAINKRSWLGKMSMWLAYNFYRTLRDLSVNKKRKRK